MNWKPKNWAVVVLNIISPPLAFLYIGNWQWALAFFASLIVLGTVELFHIFGNGFDSIVPFINIILLIAGIIISFKNVKILNLNAKPWYSRWRVILFASVITLFLLIVSRVFLYEPFKVPSTSMAPTLEVGSRVLVEKLGFGHYSAYGLQIGSRPISDPLHRGDIIVFDYPINIKQAHISRVVGLPGDDVVYRGGHLYVNGLDSQVRQVEGQSTQVKEIMCD
ncbi:signal peptidase I [Janthinobacterium sp.]|uniref:signal peptidase I n=1 Tax=Janthinobacterium sp. TaxID=1871054 RepID=UPI00293D3A47|nr:signal peptidase I [Janthinobacterium sp.]